MGVCRAISDMMKVDSKNNQLSSSSALSFILLHITLFSMYSTESLDIFLVLRLLFVVLFLEGVMSMRETVCYILSQSSSASLPLTIVMLLTQVSLDVKCLTKCFFIHAD